MYVVGEHIYLLFDDVDVAAVWATIMKRIAWYPEGVNLCHAASLKAQHSLSVNMKWQNAKRQNTGVPTESALYYSQDVSDSMIL